MNKQKIILSASTVILLLLSGFILWHYQQQREKPLTLYGNVDIRSVNLAFRVDGRLAALQVDEGDHIKAGQLLGQLDDSPYQNALRQAQANVSNAQAKLSLLQAGYRDEEIAQAKAAVDQQQATFDYADAFFKRQQQLWEQNATAANERDNARSARAQAQASLQAAKDKLAQYHKGNRPQEIAQATAELAQANAALAQAQLNVKDTQLYSPSAGTILTRAVEPGSMLNASSTVLTLSLTDPLWIRAYVSEPQLGQATAGRDVTIFTDTRPTQPYHGKIGFVSPTAEFTPKNVESADLRPDLVYRLRIIVTDADASLRQGMPVTLQLNK
jgi:HlyD family secretion protein